MNIVLERYCYSDYGTFGRLFVNNSVFHTVEKRWLANKPYESAIPEGVYNVIPYSSKKYPNVWEVIGVPGRSKILIHIANYPKDVQGCIGLGYGIKDNNMVINSRIAIEDFREMMHGVEQFTLEINQFRVEWP